jgi:hypothetical protein
LRSRCTAPSVSDAFVQGLGLNELGSPSDSELGHTILLHPSARSERREGLDFYHQDETIVNDLLRLSCKQMRGIWASVTTAESFGACAPYQARIAYQSQMLQVLERLIPISAPLMPRAAVFVDYEPFIRQIVGSDDILERRWHQHSRHGRTTRNSGAYERWLQLSDEHRQIMCGTNFRVV